MLEVGLGLVDADLTLAMAAWDEDLLVSEDLDEIFELCDRIAVIFQGRFMGILDADDPRMADIGLMMAGTPLTEPGDGTDATH